MRIPQPSDSLNRAATGKERWLKYRNKTLRQQSFLPVVRFQKN